MTPQPQMVWKNGAIFQLRREPRGAAVFDVHRVTCTVHRAPCDVRRAYFWTSKY